MSLLDLVFLLEAWCVSRTFDQVVAEADAAVAMPISSHSCQLVV
jgi:hypothetical protein